METEDAIVTIIVKVAPKEVPYFLQSWPDIRDQITQVAGIESAKISMPAQELELETW